jgi:hypothetical protein
MREFAEAEIIIPDGPKRNRRYRCDSQPYSGLFFDAVDSGKFNRIFSTGPVQSGKTLTAWIIPILYHLFEVGETVIVGVPTGDIVKDKWQVDLKPVIEASRYRDLLPSTGAGSKSATTNLIQFQNGSALRFMTGGGSDKQRSAFTARVLAVTEVDGFDKSSETSREADQFTQLEARTRAFDDRKRIYGECTVSTEQGRTWLEYTRGTASKILLSCPHCQGWVSPERGDLVGWKEADTETQAKEQSYFRCPECQQGWTEDQRKAANINSRLIHKGQELTEAGEIVGNIPAGSTLGFRWSAVNNLLIKSGSYGVDEWKASRADDEDNAEKQMRQFVWCLPYVPPVEDAVDLVWDRIVSRQWTTPKSVQPDDTHHVTCGVDVGKHTSWYCLIAWNELGRGVVFDYGSLHVPSRDLGLSEGVKACLRNFRDAIEDEFGGPNLLWCDASYETETVYEIDRESPKWFESVMGMGESQRLTGKYNAKRKRDKETPWIGTEMHGSYQPAKRLTLASVNSDYWKTETHKLLVTPVDSEQGLFLYHAPSIEHKDFAKHMTAEKRVEEYDSKNKKMVTRWEQVQRNNHLLDATYYAVAAESALHSRRWLAAPKPKQTQTAAPEISQPWSRWTR